MIASYIMKNKRSIKNLKLVSVVIPVYNAEKTLRTCVESVLNQEYQKIEIILVNDGSKDESVKIIKEYKELFPNKIVFLTQPNSGAGRARNYGLDKANGYYIIFVDSDDYVDPSYVVKLVEELDKNNAECVVSGFRRVSKTGEILYTRKISHQEWGKYSTILMCGRAFKVLSLRKNNIRFLENNIGEDVYMNILANLKLKVVTVDYIGYNWVDNSDSISNTVHKGFNKDIKFIPFLEKSFSATSNIKNLSVRDKEFLEYFFIKTCYYYILSSGKGVSYEVLSEESKKIISWLKKKYPNYLSNRIIFSFGPKGEKFSTRMVIYFYTILQRLHLEEFLLKIYSKI